MGGQGNISYSGHGVPPEHAYPFPNGAVRKSTLSCPLFGGFGHAVDGDLNVGVFVPGLLGLGRPSAISEGIPSVVVDAINLKAGNIALIHVGHEVLHFEPAFADINPTGSVTRPPLVQRVFAPAHHSFPDRVKTMIPEAVGFVNQCLAPSGCAGRDSKAFN